MAKKLKVFHGLVNYGTQAGFFSEELRKQGIRAISVIHSDPSKRKIDIELSHGGNLVQKIFKHLYNYLRKLIWFFKFNTFHFYFGKTLLPYQIDLPLYSFFNKKVIMEYLGWDVQLYQYSINKYKITNASTYKPDPPEVQIRNDEKKLKRLAYETKYVDFQIVCSPKYSEFVPNSYLLPLAVDLGTFVFQPLQMISSPIKIMHAPTSKGNKGTANIINAVNKLKFEGFNIDFILVEKVSHKELINYYKESDIFIDQILGGWYGTASIEAMAIGRPTICFLRGEYFNYIDYGEQIPIINANPNTIYEVLKDILKKVNELPEIGRKSREFVEKYHDVRNVTKKLIDIYQNKVWKI